VYRKFKKFGLVAVTSIMFGGCIKHIDLYLKNDCRMACKKKNKKEGLLRKIINPFLEIFDDYEKRTLYLKSDSTLEELVNGKNYRDKVRIKFYGTFGGFIGPLREYFLKDLVEMAIIYKDDVLLLDAGSIDVVCDREVFNEIDAILISHIHFDHIWHLYGVYKNLRKEGKEVKIYSPQKVPFWNLAKNVSTNIPKKIKSFEIEYIETKHDIKCYAYKIKVNGKVIGYTGDTAYFEELADFFKDADVIITEASLLEKPRYIDEKMGIFNRHMSPQSVIKLAKKANPKLIVLTHFNNLSPKKFKKAVEKEFERVIYATNGLELIID